MTTDPPADGFRCWLCGHDRRPDEADEYNPAICRHCAGVILNDGGTTDMLHEPYQDREL